MPVDSKRLKKCSRAVPQGVLRQHGVAKAGFHQALDRLSVVRFHDDSRCDADLLEAAVDNLTQIASLWIKQEGNVGEVSRLQDSNVTSPDLLAGVPQNQQFLLKERHDLETFFRNGQRDQAQVEAATIQSLNRFLRGIDCYPDLGF